MVEIQLSFTPEMEAAILSRRKTCTTRLEQKGEAGDTFRLKDGRVCFISCVANFKFWQIVSILYGAEGFDEPGDFTDFWNNLPGYPNHEECWGRTFPVHFFTLREER
ncbi:hypothetical protein [Methanorbis furvi]|uniref:ASCH domain-containing protein n=1 Tax=Methanorbis furvi TaxID=3028299 RepID=A0AAE4MCQ2_9EURY|nr:hypothetical protein [Methanocorpusculaceae archaeon Ag1]